jgi:plastocyanin
VADDYTFNPTFLRGSPGQNLTLRIANKGEEEHNFSLLAPQVDKDIAPAATADVTVTFPSSGVLRFFCKYHATLGMNGQLLAGDATPQPV